MTVRPTYTAAVIRFPARRVERDTWAGPEAHDDRNLRLAVASWFAAFVFGVGVWATILVAVCSWGLS